jgi:hypothetical protein
MYEEKVKIRHGEELVPRGISDVCLHLANESEEVPD